MSPLGRALHSPWLTIVKYVFTLIITVVAFIRVHNAQILYVSLVETLLCFLLCNMLASKSRVAATIVSSVLLLLINVQLFVLIFSNTFATLVMLTNLDSLEDLSGKMFVYLSAILVTLVLICLPVNHIDLKLPQISEHISGAGLMVFILFVMEAISIEAAGPTVSPLCAYIDLASQHVEAVAVEEEIKRQPNTTLEFYQEGIADHRAKPEALPKHPNVVLIFTEGLSRNIVDDERLVMPSISSYQRYALSFSNYFNHTFATYRGIIGQLYSGYQHNNYDRNTLVSLPQILHDEGYDSAFLNVEGYNKEFTNYLNTLGFDEVIDLHDENSGGPVGDGLSDKLAYEALFNEMEERDKKSRPFFLSIYTFGTHASFDSTDQKFGDGSDTELNKFYDADCQFNDFIQKFVNSKLYDDTLLVFTTDHSTYADLYFSQAFPNWPRAHMELDTIPLFFYYKGVEPEVIDVAGRNSISLAPTILDFLDISAPNYFLGTSLFGPADQATPYETFFADGSSMNMRTKDAQITVASDAEGDQIKRLMWRYYAAKRQDPLTPADFSDEELADLAAEQKKDATAEKAKDAETTDDKARTEEASSDGKTVVEASDDKATDKTEAETARPTTAEAPAA